MPFLNAHKVARIEDDHALLVVQDIEMNFHSVAAAPGKRLPDPPLPSTADEQEAKARAYEVLKDYVGDSLTLPSFESLVWEEHSELPLWVPIHLQGAR